MKDYDSVGETFRPYLMRFDNPNKNFESVSTNDQGFRNSMDANGDLIDYNRVLDEKDYQFNLMVGSSAVFGVGATSDSLTMPSQLSKLRNETWLNFGGRAYNSTQELLLLILHLRAKPKQIIIFSGVNNLTLSYLSEKTCSIYNSFFGESNYRKALGSSQVGIRKSLSHLINQIFEKISVGNNGTVRSFKDVEQDYCNILKCFERDLFCTKSLADGHGSNLTFVLQPLATWNEKKLSFEEKQLFQHLDSLNADWKVLSDHLGTWKKKYFTDIEMICDRLDVPFINLNCVDFECSDWFFVDRVHLTDAGYRLAAKLISKKIQQ